METDQEKQIIMIRLNEERLIHQRVKERLDGKIQSYTEEEKSQILNILNEQRLSKLKREEIRKRWLEGFDASKAYTEFASILKGQTNVGLLADS